MPWWLVLGALAASAWAQQTQERDLRVEKIPSTVAPPTNTPAPSTIPRGYALVVGVSNYKNLQAREQLRFAERDAELMYSTLISKEAGNFKAENVHLLIGASATLNNLRHELEDWLVQSTKPDDRVIIYFAGHGFLKDGRGWLAPYDFDRANITGTGFAMDRLGVDIGSKIQGKWKVLITDSCHSGAITPEEDAQAINRQLSDLSKSLFSLTASKDRELSFESQEWGGGHGAFTFFVAKGLEGLADANRDGIVTADELAEYVHRNVREATKGQQNPTSERGSFDPNMLLAYVPSNRAPGEAPPPKFGRLVVESNMDGVEVFINGKSQGVVDKGKPLMLPGQIPGGLTIQGVKMGYEPDGPRDEMIYPGQDTTVSIRIMIPKRRNKAAADHFDKGFEQYNKGNAGAYKKAVDDFQQALQIDPQYSQAALYLGRAYNALFDEAKAEQYFKKALEIDPDYLDASASYGGMLLDTGNYDEAIRQLNRVLQRDKNNFWAWYLMSSALYRANNLPRAVEAARNAVRIAPSNAEGHLWLAEVLRGSGNFQEAAPQYEQYLKLSDFDSRVAGKILYFAGFGNKKRASQQDIWREQRSQAYFGLCACNLPQGQVEQAVANCQKALTYDRTDPLAHFELGVAYLKLGNQSQSLGDFAAARSQFQAMLDLNSDLVQAKSAKDYIAKVNQALQTH